jgi:hypothetical protein
MEAIPRHDPELSAIRKMERVLGDLSYTQTMRVLQFVAARASERVCAQSPVLPPTDLKKE